MLRIADIESRLLGAARGLWLESLTVNRPRCLGYDITVGEWWGMVGLQWGMVGNGWSTVGNGWDYLNNASLTTIHQSAKLCRKVQFCPPNDGIGLVLTVV